MNKNANANTKTREKKRERNSDKIFDQLIYIISNIIYAINFIIIDGETSTRIENLTTIGIGMLVI